MTDRVSWAYVAAGLVVGDPVAFDADVDPNAQKSGPGAWVPVPAGAVVVCGMTWDGAAFGPIPDPSVAGLIRFANKTQWARATGGFTATIKGRPIRFPTTREALSLMDGKTLRLAQPNAPAAFNWQLGLTEFVSIEADDFVHMAVKASDFVQATFDTLPAIFAGLADGSIRTEAGVLAAAWPTDAAVIS